MPAADPAALVNLYIKGLEMAKKRIYLILPETRNIPRLLPKPLRLLDSMLLPFNLN